MGAGLPTRPALPSRMPNRSRGSGRQVVARHRSPRGRRTPETFPPPAHRRAAEGRGAGQALIFNDSFRRGAAVAVGAMTGGVVALTGAFAQSAPAVAPLLEPADAAAQLAAGVTDQLPGGE